MSDFELAKQRFEHMLVRGILIQASGNICRAARENQMHRNTLSRKIQRFGISVKECREIAKQQQGA